MLSEAVVVLVALVALLYKMRRLDVIAISPFFLLPLPLVGVVVGHGAQSGLGKNRDTRKGSRTLQVQGEIFNFSNEGNSPQTGRAAHSYIQ